MTNALKKLQFVIVWEFLVLPRKRRQFEKAYAPDGIWAQFFRTDKNYVRTELLRDPQHPHRYFTIDAWHSRRAYQRFKRQNSTEYDAIDKQCETLTKSETLIGEFENLE